jgi:hypothetical protein
LIVAPRKRLALRASRHPVFDARERAMHERARKRVGGAPDFRTFGQEN